MSGDKLHPSHETRFSDSSFYDEKCVHCGATDRTPGGWGGLALPCPKEPPEHKAERGPDEASEIDFLRYFFDDAGSAFGPADHDVYCCIMEGFERSTGTKVPEQYRQGYLSPHPEDE